MTHDEYYCIGTEEEVKEFHRKLVFDDEQIENTYNKLLPRFQKIVTDVIFTLNGSQEHFGYNFKQLIKAFGKKPEEPEEKNIVTQYLISQKLSEDIEKKFLNSASNEFVALDKDTINKRLDRAKKTASLNPTNKNTDIYQFVETICDYLLIDIDLLIYGTGKVFSIKRKWYDTYINDTKFLELAEKNYEKTWNTKLRIMEYDKYLKSKGLLKDNESILEEEYAVMTYSGAYLALKKQKGKKNCVDAVNYLINSLYVQQIFYDNPAFTYCDDE